MRTRKRHAPEGDPCRLCGSSARDHRPEHKPEGDPCTRCGLEASAHVPPKRYRLRSEKAYYAGVDGEGQGHEEHRYVMLAWSDETGKLHRYIQAPEGQRLSTEQCLEFLLNIPRAAKAFAYAFNYDITKILTDVDAKSLYDLMRPERRMRPPPYDKRPPRPVVWRNYRLNWMSSKFTIEHGKRRRVIWDVFKFFQGKFTSALEDWFSKEETPSSIDKEEIRCCTHERKAHPKRGACKECDCQGWQYEPAVASDPHFYPSETSKTGWRRWEHPDMGPDVAQMIEMKDLRADFDQLDRAAILKYCQTECSYMARLTRKLIDAHVKAGLKLRNYFGAGSTASAVLKKLGIDAEERKGPPEMDTPVASAFFGGRFENLVIGPIPGPVWGYDISSAYPYQLTFLPCLRCGTWEQTTDESRIRRARSALVRYSLGTPPPDLLWGPFPFRLSDGSIAFPATSGGGWVWREEFLEGQRLFPHVRFHEAWVYECDCDHRPFAEIPRYYVERLRIGKEGPGIVLKLGINACYGKLAQSTGKTPPFQSWIWAGMITSGTRAQILQMLGLHTDWRNMLMVATDGIYTRERIKPPLPVDTGTMTEHKKPLGGWEEKEVPQGMFAARPGIYFPANPTREDLNKIRARGVGRMSVLRNWEKLMAAFAAGHESVTFSEVSRFWGVKSSIHPNVRVVERSNKRKTKEGELFGNRYKRKMPEGAKPGSMEEAYVRTERYGQWTDREVKLSFNPLPKRERINPDGTLQIRHFEADRTSMPYKKAKSIEGHLLQELTEVLLEQPDGTDFADYDSPDV